MKKYSRIPLYEKHIISIKLPCILLLPCQQITFAHATLASVVFTRFFAWPPEKLLKKEVGYQSAPFCLRPVVGDVAPSFISAGPIIIFQPLYRADFDIFCTAQRTDDSALLHERRILQQTFLVTSRGNVHYCDNATKRNLYIYNLEICIQVDPKLLL